MSLLRPTRRRAAPDLAPRLTALREAVDLADGRLDTATVAAARAVIGRADQRLQLGVDATVVALAGATGSGKSTLFNALAGSDLSTTGVRRPTTSHASACVFGDVETGPLLDWLQVPSRHLQPAPDPSLDGLVLLDLPDHDSIAVAHRLEVDRLVDVVDMVIWVLDPQKYADAAIHERYLRPLAGHAGVMLVVLNQSDRLSPPALESCLTDLRGLLGTDGLRDVPVLPVSARTRDGLDDLRTVLGERVAARRAAVDRLVADVDRTVAALSSGCAATGNAVPDRARRALIGALAEAASVEVVASAVGGSHRFHATAATGWPFTRWLRRLRPDPLRRLRLGGGASGGGASGGGASGGGASGGGGAGAPGRTSLPAPTAVQVSRVANAVRAVADAASTDLPDPWPEVVRRAATAREADLPELLERRVALTDLGTDRRPRWWQLVSGLQWLLAANAVAGAVWLAALLGLAYLQIDDPPTPEVGVVPVPTLMLVGGLAAGFLLAFVSRMLAGVGARRRAAAARRRLLEGVDAVSREYVLEPVDRELAAHRSICDALAVARG